MDRKAIQRTDDQMEVDLTLHPDKHFTSSLPKNRGTGPILSSEIALLTDSGAVTLGNSQSHYPEITIYQIDQSYVDFDYLVTYQPTKCESYKARRGHKVTKKFTTLGHESSPEKGLLAAIIWRAIEDLRSTQRKTKTDAYIWLHVDESLSNLQSFSFPWICSELGIDKAKLLSRIDKDITLTPISSNESLNE